MSLPSDFFIAGGTLRARAPSYVTRLADQELFEHTLAGEFCYVLTPRQMGKSSLMIRTARSLAEAGCTVAILDLTGIGSGSADQWYLGLLEQIARDLRLNIDVPKWWQARASLAIPQRFSEFLRDVVLQEIATPVVIFIDEIDSTLNLDFRDDFFAAIRAIYNARATESAYKRLTFALLGVATPTDLIHDRERTPFNIGRRIVLQEFSYDEAESLKAGLEACHPGQGDVILRRIFNWTNGYPYLTQKLCLAAAERRATHWDAAQVDELVEATFFSDTGRKDPNFKFVQQRIQESSAAARRQMLNLYRKVYSGASVPDDDRSQSQNYLELYGLVRVERGRLHVRNDIYQRIFDHQWIAANMPANRDLRLAIGASLVALLVIVAVVIKIIQTPSPSASLYVKQFNDNAFPTARIEALAGLFNLQDGLYDRDDEQGLSLFYNLGPYDQLKLFSQANARQGRAMVTAIRRISLTLDEQDSNDLAIMGEMITALGASGQPGTDALVEELTNWKSGRELAEKGLYHDAIAVYSSTIELSPDNFIVRYDQAMAYIGVQEYRSALIDLDRMIAITDAALTMSPTATATAATTPGLISAAPSSAALPLGTAVAGLPSEGPTDDGQPTGEPDLPAGAAETALAEAPRADVISRSRFINAKLSRQTVIATIRNNPELWIFWQANRGSAYPELLAIAVLVPTPTSEIAQQPTATNEFTQQPVAANAETEPASISPTPVFSATQVTIIDGPPGSSQTFEIRDIGLIGNSFEPGDISRIRMIVLHATSGRYPGDLLYIRQGGFPALQASYHYYIDTAGIISQMVQDKDIAFHAGRCSWQVDGQLITNRCNAISIGGTLSNRNTGQDPYPQAQFDAAVALVRHLVEKYNIPRSQLVRHLDISPGQNTDPAGFPWHSFVNQVYGSADATAPTATPLPPTPVPPTPTPFVTYQIDIVPISLTEITALPGCEQLAVSSNGKTNNLCIVGPGRINLQLYNLDSNGRFGPIPTDARQLYINEGQRTRITVVSDASQLPVTTIGRNQLLPAPGQYYKAVITKIR